MGHNKEGRVEASVSRRSRTTEGSIRVASHLVADAVSQGHVSMFTTSRQIIRTNYGHRRAFYQLVYDGGDVAFAEYVRKILSESG